MMAQRIIPGLVMLLLGLWLATQAFAYHARYAPALGEPLWYARHFGQVHGVYTPWKVVGWSWRWGTARPDLLKVAATWGGLPILAGLVMLVWSPQRSSRQNGPPPMEGHGSGRWGTAREAREAGLR